MGVPAALLETLIGLLGRDAGAGDASNTLGDSDRAAAWVDRVIGPKGVRKACQANLNARPSSAPTSWRVA